jgi:hypothetical protein
VPAEPLPLSWRLRAQFRAWSRRAAAAAMGVIAGLLSPSAVVAALLLAAGGLFVAGVYTLFGHGWSLMAASFVLVLLAAALARGMTKG